MSNMENGGGASASSRMAFSRTQSLVLTSLVADGTETDELDGFYRAWSSFSVGSAEPEGIFRAPELSPRVVDTSDGGVQSRIHDAAQITDWSGVLRLCRTYPEDAKYKCPGSRLTALHHTCSRRCPKPEVADALIQAYPDALLDVDEKAWTPLHHACRFKAPKDVVRLLLRSIPEKGRASASMRCNKGRTPLFYAIRYDAPDGVMEMLLEANPTAVLDEDREGVSPLDLVWGRYAQSVNGQRHLQPYKDLFEDHHYTISSNPLQLEGKPQLLKMWKMANLLLKAAFRFPFTDEYENNETTTNNNKQVWRILHATSAIQCHPSLFMLSCLLHPEQAKELDENDLYRNTEPLSEEPQSVFHRRTALHLAASSTSHGKVVISALLKLNKEAAQVKYDADGSLPLHIMCENESKSHWIHDGFQDVYNAYQKAPFIQNKFQRTALHRAAAVVSHRQSSAQSNRLSVSEPQTSDTNITDIGSIVQNLVRINPAAAKVADNTGRLPLHYIAECAEVWDNDARAIFDAWPKAARQRAGASAHNRFPIHMAACSPDSKKTLIESLINAHKLGVRQYDNLGKLPLHLACEAGKKWDSGVSSIYEAYPKGIEKEEENPRKWTALHMVAASPNAGDALLDKLTMLYPDAAKKLDNRGRTPFHWACTRSKPWEGIKTLFEANAAACMTEDKEGLLPFHLAVLKYSSSSPSFLDDNLSHTNIDNNEVTELSRNSSRSIGDMKSDSGIDLIQLDVLYNLIQVDPHVLHVH